MEREGWISIPAGLSTAKDNHIGFIFSGLAGFILAGLVYWLLESVLFKKLMTGTVKTWIFGALNSIIFEVVMYITGVIWFMTVYAAQTGPVGLATVLGWCVIPFSIPDIVKLIAAVVIGERARKLVR